MRPLEVGDAEAAADVRRELEPALGYRPGVIAAAEFREADAAARSMFEARGYCAVRRFYEMAVELTEPPPAPSWPPGIELAQFRPEDARAYYDALAEA